MLYPGSGWKFRRISEEKVEVKILKPGQVVKFLETGVGIILKVEVINFLRIINEFKQDKETIEAVDYSAPYAVIIMDSSGNLVKVLDRDVEHI